jgi:hypothetical protein
MATRGLRERGLGFNFNVPRLFKIVGVRDEIRLFLGSSKAGKK